MGCCTPSISNGTPFFLDSFSNGFWDFFYQVLLPRKEGRKEGKKEGRKNEAGRREGRRKEGSKQGSKQVSEEGRKGGRPRPPPNPLPLFKFKQVTQTKPANQFASDWPAKHLTLKHTTEKGPGQKRLLVIGFLARGRSIYVVFLAGRRCALPRTPSRSFY